MENKMKIVVKDIIEKPIAISTEDGKKQKKRLRVYCW